jgi:hypothetical protein
VDEMSGTCGTYSGDEKHLGGENLRKITRLENLSTDVRKILKWDLKK